MAQKLIDKINSFNTFKFDTAQKRVVNLQDFEGADVDEFLEIQYLLDCHRVEYNFEKNFEIQIKRNLEGSHMKLPNF